MEVSSVTLNRKVFVLKLAVINHLSNLGMLLHLGGEILKVTLIRDRESLEKYR